VYIRARREAIKIGREGDPEVIFLVQIGGNYEARLPRAGNKPWLGGEGPWIWR
jgi:hypothetical protein